MRVELISKLDLLAPHAEQWDRLAGGIPFNGWAWMSTWWRYYGVPDEVARSAMRLYVLLVWNRHDELAGLAPWYLDTSTARGRVVRFLGSGDVCSDHQSVLCQKGEEDAVTQALADWLTEQRPGAIHCWDLMEWDGVDLDQPVMTRLMEQLAIRGSTVHARPGPNCWRIELPTRWDDYLAGLSKNRRKKIRRAQRRFLDNGRAVLHSVRKISELPRAMEILIELHQRRRRALGHQGSFASGRFTAFHRSAVESLLRAGQLQLHWLEVDDEPVAAEYQVAGDGILYAYQAGINPSRLEIEPGHLITIALVRWAIQSGYRAYDLLRGDEPYKTRWGATPRATRQIRVVPQFASAQFRHGAWLAGESVKQWVKRGWELVAGPS